MWCTRREEGVQLSRVSLGGHPPDSLGAASTTAVSSEAESTLADPLFACSAHSSNLTAGLIRKLLLLGDVIEEVLWRNVIVARETSNELVVKCITSSDGESPCEE